MIALNEECSEWMGWLEDSGETLTFYTRLQAPSQYPHDLHDDHHDKQTSSSQSRQQEQRHNFQSQQRQQGEKRKVDVSSLAVEDKLAERLKPLREKKWFLEGLEALPSVHHVPDYLKKCLSGLKKKKKEAQDHLPGLLVSELDRIGWEHFVSVNASLDAIKLRCEDRKGYEHVFEVLIPSDYPLMPPRLVVDLPVQVQLPPSNVSYSFQQILKTVKLEIERHENLIEVLRDIDDNTKILEPTSRSFAILTRRLAVSRTCSITIAIASESPRNPCQIRYMGPQEEVAVLRNNFTKNIGKWSTEELLRRNLENTLEVQFIEPSDVEDLSFLNECGICYSYHLKGDKDNSSVSETEDFNTVPDQLCLNKKCGRLYHSSCLITWLQSVPTNKSSFGTLFGNCPYCSESISVRAFS